MVDSFSLLLLALRPHHVGLDGDQGLEGGSCCFGNA